MHHILRTKEYRFLSFCLVAFWALKLLTPMVVNTAVAAMPAEMFANGKPIFVCSSIGFKTIVAGESDDMNQQGAAFDCPLCQLRDQLDGDAAISPHALPALPYAGYSEAIWASIQALHAQQVRKSFHSQAPPVLVLI